MKNLNLYISLIISIFFLSACSTTQHHRLSCPDFKKSYSETKRFSKQTKKKKSNERITIAKPKDHSKPAIMPKEILPSIMTGLVDFSETNKETTVTIQSPEQMVQALKMDKLMGMRSQKNKKEKTSAKTPKELNNKQNVKRQKQRARLEKKLAKVHKIVEKKAKKKQKLSEETSTQNIGKTEPTGIVGFAIGILGIGVSAVGLITGWSGSLVFLLCMSLLAILLGLISLIRIELNPDKFQGKKFVNLSILSGSAGIILTVLYVLTFIFGLFHFLFTL